MRSGGLAGGRFHPGGAPRAAETTSRPVVAALPRHPETVLVFSLSHQAKLSLHSLEAASGQVKDYVIYFAYKNHPPERD
jgi:hypothetical protein